MVTITPTSSLAGDVLLFEVPAPRDEKWIAQLQERYPGLEIRWHTSELTMMPKPLPDEVYDGVTLLVGFMPHPAEKLPKVRYVQLMSAGADRWTTNDLYKNPNVTFCTANGTHAYVFG